MVFSILHPDRIDLSQTKARAVADLKHFLEYAKHGTSALAATVYDFVGDFDSPFKSAVARALRDKGWDVHSQVDVSAYRIDLGIVHHDFPDIYFSGVECDGAMYHGFAFARERDKILQSVLERLGWTLWKRMPYIPEGHRFEVVPDWVCEILSPSTASKDREVKMPLYARYGVPHAWLIDPGEQTLEVYRIDGGTWVEGGVFSDTDQVVAPPFEAVSIDLGLFWPPRRPVAV